MKVFAERGCREACVADRGRRVELRARRRDLKERLQAVADDEAEAVRVELALLRRRSRRQRRLEWKRRADGLVEKMWVAWRARRVHRIYRIAMLLQANHRAPKKRTYGLPPMSKGTAEEWVSYLEQDPALAAWRASRSAMKSSTPGTSKRPRTSMGGRSSAHFFWRRWWKMTGLRSAGG